MSSSLDANYTALSIVQSVHELPHLNPLLEEVDNDYDYSYDDSLWGNTYMVSLLVFPILCAFLAVCVISAGYLVTLGTMYFYRLRDICQYASCSIPMGRLRAPTNRSVCTRDMVQFFSRFFFIVSIMLMATVFVCDQSLLIGNGSITSGIGEVGDAVQYLEDTFHSLKHYGDEMQLSGDTLKSYISQIEASADPASSKAFNSASDIKTSHIAISSKAKDKKKSKDDDDASSSGSATNGDDCLNVAGLMGPLMDFYSDNLSAYQEAVEPLHSQYDHLTGQFYFWSTLSNSGLVLGSYAALLAPLVVFATGTFVIKENKLLWAALLFSIFIMLGTLALWSVEFTVLMGTADFCMAPIDNLIRTAPLSAQDDVRYYSTCAGPDPYVAYTSTASSFLDGTRTIIASVVDSAGNSKSNIHCAAGSVELLKQSLVQLDSIDSSIAGISDLADCSAAQSQIYTALYDGLCDDGFQGLFTVWAGQDTCMLFLWLLGMLYLVAVAMNVVASDPLFDMCFGILPGGASSAGDSSSNAGGTSRGAGSGGSDSVVGTGSRSAQYEMVPLHGGHDSDLEDGSTHGPLYALSNEGDRNNGGAEGGAVGGAVGGPEYASLPEIEE